MANKGFHLSDQSLQARLRRLDGQQAAVMALVSQNLAGTGADRYGNAETRIAFCLPLAEAGLSGPQIFSLLDKVPEGFPLDHREIYFDFRLARWIKHIEPPTFSRIMDEYLEHSPTEAEGLAYLKKEWTAFLGRHPGG